MSLYRDGNLLAFARILTFKLPRGHSGGSPQVDEKMLYMFVNHTLSQYIILSGDGLPSFGLELDHLVTPDWKWPVRS